MHVKEKPKADQGSVKPANRFILSIDPGYSSHRKHLYTEQIEQIVNIRFSASHPYVPLPPPPPHHQLLPNPKALDNKPIPSTVPITHPHTPHLPNDALLKVEI
jgi:hypothetical protein